MKKSKVRRPLAVITASVVSAAMFSTVIALPAEHAPGAVTSLAVIPPIAVLTRAQSNKQATDSDFMVVDCLLPGKLRRLGRRNRYITPRRPVRTTTVDCQIRGGEYTAYDRASYQSALTVWLPEARAGSAEAQYFVGQIYDRGLGVAPDYQGAARWYQQAADQGHSAAQTSLAYLYEVGLGVAQDSAKALNLYRAAAGVSADLIVLADTEYERLLEAERERTAALVRVAELESRRQTLAGELELAREGADSEARRADQIALSLQDLERELAASRQVIASLNTRVDELEGQLSASQATTRNARTAEATEAAEAMRSQKPPQRVDYGPYHALVIANGRYQNLPPLAEAAERGESMARLLEQRYGFRVERLLDATRYQVLSALNRLRETLTEKDNLLVYYFGRSESDLSTQRSWWQPIDAEPDSRANWLPSRVLGDHLELIPAKHVLVVADAAFSGLLTRSAVPRLPQGMSEGARLQQIQGMLDHRVRLVLSNDSAHAATGRSFSAPLLEVLTENQKVVEASEIYRRLATKIAATPGSPSVAIPVFAPIRWAGASGGGDFFFVPR